MVNATACHAVDWEFDPPSSRHFLPGSVMVTQATLTRYFLVRIEARQPIDISLAPYKSTYGTLSF